MSPRALLLIVSVIVVPACKNAIYYYETDKIAIQLEERPDASQPVSFTVGAKQRVVAVLPPKKDGDGGDPKDDAVSLISYFNFDYEDGSGLNNPTLVQTALITGAAAAGLTPNQAKDAYGELASAAPGRSTENFTAITLILDNLDGLDDANARELMTAVEEDSKAIVAGLSDFSEYKWNSPGNGTAGSMTKNPITAPTADKAWSGLRVYFGNLADSVSSLDRWAADMKFARDAEPERTAAMSGAEYSEILGLWNEWKIQTRQHEELYEKIRGSKAIVAATNAYFEYLHTGSVPKKKEL